MGGIPISRRLYGPILLMAQWRNLPESDPSRQVLVQIFAHQAFQNANAADPGCDAEAMAFGRADGTHTAGSIARSSRRGRHQYDHAGDL